MPDGPRYDDDHAWIQYQAKVLRPLRTDDNRFDREHLAEEVEDFGKGERTAVCSQVRRILDHFLELAYSPAPDPRFGRIGSIVEARVAMEDQISASLRRDIEALFPKLYRDARQQTELALLTHGEGSAATTLPRSCSSSFGDVVREGWYPEPAEAPK
jgi:Domain of unknown function DUF29